MSTDTAFHDAEKAEASQIEPGWMVYLDGEWKTVAEVNDERDFLTDFPMRRLLFTDDSTVLCDADATARVRRPAHHTSRGDV